MKVGGGGVKGREEEAVDRHASVGEGGRGHILHPPLRHTLTRQACNITMLHNAVRQVPRGIAGVHTLLQMFQIDLIVLPGKYAPNCAAPDVCTRKLRQPRGIKNATAYFHVYYTVSYCRR